MSFTDGIIPNLQLAQELKSQFFNARTVQGEDNPFLGAPCVPSREINGAGFDTLLWSRFGAEFGSGSGEDRTVWSPEMVVWSRLALREAHRLAPGTVWITGPAGTGKTTEIVRLMKHLSESPETQDGRTWLVTVANVACEVLRSALKQNGLKHHASCVSTIHSRFELGGRDGGYEGFPAWWPTPPNAGKKTVKGACYVFDEAFFIDPRALALSLACIPTGAKVIFAGDPYQNRPISGVELGYWLWKTMTHRVRVEDDLAADAVWYHWTYGSEKISPSLRSRLDDVPVNKVLALDLTKIRRFESSLSALQGVHEKIFSGEFPSEGAGLKITRLPSEDAALKYTVGLMNSCQPAGQKYSAIVATNRQAAKLTMEFNRADRIITPADEEGMYFRRGQPVMMIKNEHARGLHNGMICTYLRWGRSKHKHNSRPFHEVEVNRAGEGFSRKVKIFYNASSLVSTLRRPMHQLKDEFDDVDIVDMMTLSHAVECRGILCSPYILTNHRAQGSTVGRAVVFIPSSWKGANASWLYVALTRARHGVEIVFCDDSSKSKEENDIAHEVLKAKLVRAMPHGENPFANYKAASIDKAA